ncbi:unknown [Bacillus sp. CAG:988]|nr:unknown [Bacillus sp. CAG:988]
MANWVTETTASTFDQNSAINTAMTNRQGVRETGAGNTGNNGNNIFLEALTGQNTGLSLVGLSATKIGQVRETIRAEVADIEKHLNDMNSAADTGNAFKSHEGEVEKAVKEAVDNVKQYVINLTSGLLAFSDKLADVNNTWQSQTETMAGNITTTTGQSNAGTKYTESVQ